MGALGAKDGDKTGGAISGGAVGAASGYLASHLVKTYPHKITGPKLFTGLAAMGATTYGAGKLYSKVKHNLKNHDKSLFRKDSPAT